MLDGFWSLQFGDSSVGGWVVVLMVVKVENIGKINIIP